MGAGVIPASVCSSLAMTPPTRMKGNSSEGCRPSTAPAGMPVSRSMKAFHTW